MNKDLLNLKQQNLDKEDKRLLFHKMAQQLLQKGMVAEAWKVLLSE
jgi:mannitol/fructose-specific phosphotransferase system IIA component (Ntr-type)